MIRPGKVHGKLAGKGMEAYRDLWYRIPIGTLSMGCYGNEEICDRQLSQWRDVAASALID